MSAADWTWILAAVSILGSMLDCRDPRVGWFYNIAAQMLLWAPYSWLTDQPGMVAMSLVFTGISIVALYRWRGTDFVPAAATTTHESTAAAAVGSRS